MKNLALCLQLFAEAADGDTAQFTGETEAAAAPQATGEECASDAGMQEDLRGEFEQLIKGKFKALYDERLQDTLKKRLRGNKELSEKISQLEPLVQTLAAQYGVAPEDISGLHTALTREQDPAQQAEIADAQMESWMDQAQSARRLYPGFDLKQELCDPRFARLLQGGADVATAYEVLHKEKLIPQAMHYTAKVVEQLMANKMLSDAARPAENGTAGVCAASVRQDVSQMSRLDRAEIIRRVQAGEKIRF